MALMKCKECGADISKKAKECPSCGAAPKKKTSLFTWLVLLIILVAGYGILTTPESIPQKPTFDTSQEAQSKRQKLIDQLIASDVIYKVEQPGDLPYVYVAPAFYQLPIDTKRSYVGVVYAYYLAQSPEASTVVLYDGRSGKQIGIYSEYGLDLE